MRTLKGEAFLRAAVLLTIAAFGGDVLAQAQTLTTIHSFTGNNGDGQEPYPQHLAIDSQGAVYGTTVTNASPYWGTVFQLVPPTKQGGAWKENVLYDFQGWDPTGDGAQPQQAWCSTKMATSTARPLSAATPAPAAVGAA